MNFAIMMPQFNRTQIGLAPSVSGAGEKLCDSGAPGFHDNSLNQSLLSQFLDLLFV